MSTFLRWQRLVCILGLLLFVCSKVARGQIVNYWGCPGNVAAENTLRTACTFIDSTVLASVKAGNSDALRLFTHSSNMLPRTCEPNCLYAITTSTCLDVGVRNLVEEFCGCRTDLMTANPGLDCVLAVDAVVPVIMDPLFSFSDHLIDVSNGVVSSEFVEAASPEGMCGVACFTAIESSTSCKYDPLFQKVASICCSNELNQECTELYQTMADLADPTDPEKFPTAARVLVALDATKLNQERIIALHETDIESVKDLMFAPFLELCGKINLDELSVSVANCKSQCSGLSNAGDEEEANFLAGICSTVNSNACVEETLRVCMPSYRAEDVLGFDVLVSGGFASDDGELQGGRRGLLEYQGAQYFFTAPTSLVLAVLEGADNNGEVELMNDYLKAIKNALCSVECGELITSCPAASSIPGINGLIAELQDAIAIGLCVEPPTPPPTPPPPAVVSSPPPPVPSSPPSPSSTPSTPEDQYFLSRASLSLSLSLAEFDDAVRSTLTSDLFQATSDEPVSVDILGVEATNGGGVVAHVAVVFQAVGSLQSRLNDQGVFSSTVGFQTYSSFVTEAGTTLSAVNSRIVELKAQYTTTPPPTPTTTTPAPSSPSGQQFRVVQIEATLPLLFEGDFTDALRDQFIADLERLPGVASARIMQVQGWVVKSAVIVAGESAADATALLSLTSALSSSSENFATKLGDVSAAVKSFETVDSLDAANERMAQLVAEGDSDGNDSASSPLPLWVQFRVVQIEATLPLLTEGDFTDALRDQFIADLERLPGVASARIIQVQGWVVKSAVIVAGESAAGATALQSLTSALSSSSENFATKLGDVSAAVKSFETVDSLDAANERMAQLVAEGDSDGNDSAPPPLPLWVQFLVVQIDATLPLLSEGDFTDALRDQFIADLERLPGVASARIIQVQGWVVKSAVIVAGESAADATALLSLTSALSSSSENFATELGDVFATVKSFEIVDSLDTANERMAQLVAEGDSDGNDSPPLPPLPLWVQFRVVQIEATLPLLTEGDFTDALRDQFIAGLERLPGVASARIIQVQGSKVKSAVIVAGESAADATALQSLTSALSSSFKKFATELGDVTATVKSFEIVDSLDAANERMAQLVAEGDSDGNDSAGIRLTASLALLIPALFALF